MADSFLQAVTEEAQNPTPLRPWSLHPDYRKKAFISYLPQHNTLSLDKVMSRLNACASLEESVLLSYCLVLQRLPDRAGYENALVQARSRGLRSLALSMYFSGERSLSQRQVLSRPRYVIFRIQRLAYNLLKRMRLDLIRGKQEART